METKTCPKCQEVLEISLFVVNNRRPSGRGSLCKKCHNAINRAHAKANSEREAARSRAKAKLPHNRARQLEYNRKNPEKYAAHKAVTIAIKRGELAPAAACQCMDCNATPAQTLHHHSYHPDHWLDVIPLCRSCHGIRHSQPELFQ